MNKNASALSNEHFGNRKLKRKISKTRLPTPPPDPTLGDQQQQQQQDSNVKTTTKKSLDKDNKDAEVFEYLESLQKEMQPTLARSTSVFAPAIAAEDAFDHLEKLYKLMEQMLTLREQNAKLHRRVRDLEHLRNLQSMHRQFDNTQTFDELPELDNDSIYAERLLETMLLDSKKELKTKIPSRLRQSILRRQRNRSSSMAVDKGTASELDSSYKLERRASTPVTGPRSKHSKVSKWTKVKAAFKWEKASPTVGEIKLCESNGLVPVNYELARYLRVPSTNDEMGTSITDSGAAEISTPGTISLSSSIEDIHGYDGRKEEVRDYSSDDDQSYSHDYIPHSKDEHNILLKSAKSLRTPWAKMKDIIQTRNSLKKKHRLSAKSDDIKIDESIESDNEDVFEDTKPTKIHFADDKPKFNDNKFSFNENHQIPTEIIERYKLLSNEESKIKHVTDSKWNLVKKAFITNLSTNKEYPQISNSIADSKSDVLNPKKEHELKLQEEIQKNYKELREKLSLEFQDKFHEWDKAKQPPTSACSSTGSPSILIHEDVKDQAFMKKIEEWEKIKSQPKHNYQITSEENLPPDFKKKLQEWQKMKKSSVKDDTKKKANEKVKTKTTIGYKSDIEQRPLSDEFLKKLETWKQIKSGTSTSCDECSSKRSTVENKTPSPKMGRKDSGGRNQKKLKDQTEKELQWFEKELNKIEREKQRLERERQKFLEREERLSKLRRSVVGNKKEVLVHTPSGFYRFEGISRKFTQKLYEWEKAQGIGPEASTFALLKSCYPHDRRINTIRNKNMKTLTLFRSKSADSIANSSLNLLCPILSEQPSSLSLNDVESFENNLLQSRTSSMRDITRSEDNVSPNEPQAVIFEVEDIIEETAAPLESFLEKQEQPIYQKEGNGQLLESKRNSGPKIHRSESTRAQANYNLIEKIIHILKTLSENENQIQLAENQSINLNELILKENKKTSVCDQENDFLLKQMYENEKQLLTNLVEKLISLQQANNAVASKISKQGIRTIPSHLEDDLENVQDLSSELLQMAEKLEINAYNRSKHFTKGDSLNYTKKYYSVIPFTLNQLTSKIFETRRILSYICAASDMTAPSRKKKLVRRNCLSKSSSIENKSNGKNDSTDTATDKQMEIKERRNNSYDETRIPVGQGAIKKRIRYKQKDVRYKAINDSDDDEISDDIREIKTELSTLKNEQISNTFSNQQESSKNIKRNSEEIIVDAEILEKVVVPTKTTILSLENLTIGQVTDTPVTVFVKTTRKLFTPIAGIEDKEVECNTPNSSYHQEYLLPTIIKDVKVNETNTSNLWDIVNDEDKKPSFVTHLPPLPASPTPQRKFKEISPSIRLMMVKYNQKVEQESSGYKSGGSSGSASPVAWRSPVMERRVKAQTEKYQEDLKKMSPLLERREVQKSASLGFLSCGKKQFTVHKTKANSSDSCGILKSSSADIINEINFDTNTKPVVNNKAENNRRLKLTLPTNKINSQTLTTPEARAKKIQKAKEDFLNSPIPGPSSAPPKLIAKEADFLKYPARNRLSQISVGSDTSCDSSPCEGWLIKSASAGMINVDPNTYKQFDPTVHADGYVSLPRANKKHKPNIFNNITAKFRKVKMRRNRETNKMNTISTLCRQSLVVDINENPEIKPEGRKDSLNVPSISGGSSSEDTSTPSSRSGSWIKRAKFFKNKQ